jgi:hypothetical protein
MPMISLSETVRLRLCRRNPIMSEESNIEDVAPTANDFSEATSEEVQREAFGEPHIGDVDTAEGQARRAEEAHLKEIKGDGL